MIATYLDLSRDPNTNTNAVEVLAPSLGDADAIADRLSKLPEVSRVHDARRASSPSGQQEKLPLIRDAAKTLGDAFDPKNAMPPPTDAENVDALKEGAGRLIEAAGDQSGSGASAAKRLAAALTSIADGEPGVAREGRDRVHPAAEGGLGRSAGVASCGAGDAEILAARLSFATG